MKSILTLLGFLFIVINNGISQDKGYIALNIGPSIPTGDFGSQDAHRENAGLATTGAIIDVSFAYKFGNKLGMTAMLLDQINPLDAQSIADLYAENFPGVQWSTESQSWTLAGLMVGGYGSFPIGEGKTSFETRAMIGFLHATSPDIRITGTDGSLTAFVKLHSAGASDFAYLLGAGFKFNTGKKICFLTNVDYMSSSPEFKDAKVSSNTGTSYTRTFTQTFQTINFSVGIGIRI